MENNLESAVNIVLTRNVIKALFKNEENYVKLKKTSSNVRFYKVF